ncbi:hypothetical protein [Clostridium scatologenes]|uniref:Uncharacterized protein n=1 Tax=Clostridium scatologenes TaxID=1548 RepID=A0A0E3M8L2_CLOSL|nr:hypothetical protein [Clostridium scatologenes]AKA68513.1 hypothetical protein CSCA_1388 [Clostridium scatologenes]
MGFEEFRKDTGFTCAELEKITGYTRQGIHKVFSKTEKGKPLSKKFLVGINAAIEKKIKEETEQHENKISKLREMQEKLKEDGNE